MNRTVLSCLTGIAVCLLSAPLASGRDLSEFPLRVHVFQNTNHVHYVREVIDRVDGMGRADLFEGGEPKGFDYEFTCSDRLMTSSGFETYPARWKRKDQVLELLIPVMGKQGATKSCELKVEMKDFVYYKHGNALETEPRAAFKQWMEKHQYDPEHGKNQPVGTAPKDDAKE